MLEQATGIYTGTVYGDRKLFDSGKMFEIVCSKSYVLIYFLLFLTKIKMS